MGIDFEAGECRMCGNNTSTVVNISFKAVSICDSCCNLITKQNIIWIINEELPRLYALTTNKVGDKDE